MAFLPASIRESEEDYAFNSNTKHDSFFDKVLEDLNVNDVNKMIKNMQSVGEDVPMTVNLITDKILDANIKYYNMKPVTDPIAVKQGTVPTPNGLYSPYIFGVSQDEKRKRFGYINLNCKVFHPFIYTILDKLYPRSFSKIASGYGSWIIENGKFIEVTEDDEKYNEEHTGIPWLIKNIKEIDIPETNAMMRKERLKLINSLTLDDMVITKWIVIPVFYREMRVLNGIMDEDAINGLYKKIISYSSQLDNNIWNTEASNNTVYRIQKTLVEIRKSGQELIESKRGFFKKSVLGKSIDYGYRSVISLPNIESYDTANQCPVDVFHTGIPLSQCLILGFPLIRKEIMDFFTKLTSRGDKIYALNEKGEVRDVLLKDPASHFTPERIKKEMDKFIEMPSTRFKTVNVIYDYSEYTDKSDITFIKKMEDKSIKPTEDEIEEKLGRPMALMYTDDKGVKHNRNLTWTDVFYICSVRALRNIHCYVTRYPLVDYFGIFPSRIHVLSTIKTTTITYEGMEFPNYPIVDLNMSKEDVSIKFIDTVTMSNTYLDGLGGDYDGDQVSIKFVYSQEANEEAERLLNSPKHYINIAGKIMRSVKNETYLTFHNMTR